MNTISPLKTVYAHLHDMCHGEATWQRRNYSVVHNVAPALEPVVIKEVHIVVNHIDAVKTSLLQLHDQSWNDNTDIDFKPMHSKPDLIKHSG
jgi:hypothetical protein